MNRKIFDHFPYIDLGDIVLRRIQIKDAQDYLDYMSKSDMKYFLTDDNIPNNFDEALEEVQYWGGLFSLKRSVYWAIALKGSDKMIGTVGFNQISFNNARADISYDLNPDFWGQGIMTKSIKAILKYAKNTAFIIRVQATVVTTNERSIKLLENLAFKKEGLLEKYEFVNGEYTDYYMYAAII